MDLNHLGLLPQITDSTKRQDERRRAFNRWRIAHPEVKVDLSFADLSDRVLDDLNLTEADLHGATSTCRISAKRAKLGGINLKGSHFHALNLENADLGNRIFWDEKTRLEALELRNARNVPSELQAAITRAILSTLHAS